MFYVYYKNLKTVYFHCPLSASVLFLFIYLSLSFIFMYINIYLFIYIYLFYFLSFIFIFIFYYLSLNILKNPTIHCYKFCLQKSIIFQRDFKIRKKIWCIYPNIYHFQCFSFLCVHLYFHLLITFFLPESLSLIFLTVWFGWQ